MKCKKCLLEKSKENFTTYYKNNILYQYHVCKKCYDRNRENEMDSKHISWVRFTETELKKHKLEVINKISQRLEGVV